MNCVKSDERKCRRLDLEKAEAEAAAAHGNRCGRDLHGARGLSRGINYVSGHNGLMAGQHMNLVWFSLYLSSQKTNFSTKLQHYGYKHSC